MQNSFPYQSYTVSLKKWMILKNQLLQCTATNISQELLQVTIICIDTL